MKNLFNYPKLIILFAAFAIISINLAALYAASESPKEPEPVAIEVPDEMTVVARTKLYIIVKHKVGANSECFILIQPLTTQFSCINIKQ